MAMTPSFPPAAAVIPILAALTVFAVLLADAREKKDSVTASSARLPTRWENAWSKPVMADRPLQIVHGFSPAAYLSPEDREAASGVKPDDIALRAVQSMVDRGLGGMVANVPFGPRYLQSEDDFTSLAIAVDACRKVGMTVWLYDEEGYPSGAAGGLVLREHPEYEALELARDPSLPDGFVVRPAYEHAHASNNYHAARRYPNPIDPRAVRSFIDKTHETYRKRLGNRLGGAITAFFTDEPSLMAVNLGRIPESARKNVPVVDPVDPAVPSLPSVPWSVDLADRYRERHGEDLMARRASLFEGDDPDDRRTRRRFWSLIAELMADRYFGQIRKWCASAGVASSGHTLWEEAILHHPALEGNALKALSRMDIPGLDVLSSNPEAVIHGSWLTAALPSSAALWNGSRRVMTEVSDFSEKMGGSGPAGLAEMRATAAWQAAWGVTDFTLYYGFHDRPADLYRAYGDFVGRLNAILKPARWEPEVLLYYPIHDLWEEYRPAAGPLSMESQTPRARRIVESFQRLGQLLQRNRIPFALIDHERLADGKPAPDSGISVEGRRFRAVVLPEEVSLPPGAETAIGRVRARGGTVLRDGSGAGRLSPESLRAAIRPSYGLSPEEDRIALGCFSRAGRRVLAVVNVGSSAYRGRLTVDRTGEWVVLDPGDGSKKAAVTDSDHSLSIEMEPRQTLLLVSSPRSGNE